MPHRSRWTAITAGLLVAIATVVVVPRAAEADPAGVFRTLDWESATDRAMPADNWDFVKHSVTGHGVTMVQSPVRNGSYAARFDLRVGDTPNHNGKRAEVSQGNKQQPNADRWYGFSINLANDWAYDNSPEIVSQWHDCDEKACGGGSPPLALITKQGKWWVDFQGTYVDLKANYVPGQWTDWVFHIKWRSDTSGVVEIFRNGNLIKTLTGRTYDGGPYSPYFKMGIYKWDWSKSPNPSSTTQRVMYYDALRLGNERATFADVDPAQSTEPPPPPPPTCAAFTKTAVAAASASTSEPGNLPANTIDGNLGTRWSGQGAGASLFLDLGIVQRVCGTQVAWHLGNTRWNDFTVSTSVDGLEYTQAWTGRSSGTTAAAETQVFPGGPRDARHVKVTFAANPTNNWASITEAAVVGRAYGCTASAPVKGVTASTSEAVNPPVNAVDGNLATRWSGQGYGASLVLDLGTAQLVCGSKLAWYQGNGRWNDFTVYTSVDGTAYTKAWAGRSSGTSSALEAQKFPGAPRSARFVKVTFWANPVNNWASITEAAVQVSS